MKKHIQQDERILAQKRKIGSDAYNIVWIGLLISILVQQYLFEAPFTQYAVETILFISGAIYVVVRNLLGGNDLFASKKGSHKLVIINSLVCGIIVTIINTVLNYMKYSDTTPLPIGVNTVLVAVITFASATIAAFIPLELLYLANKKKQKQIENSLDADDE
ncbi:MAG: hypothetical protein PHS82_00485 [Lachnospiraceae bacterium]|nr:hypothetical protein [Lachnospiraceae bacterium]